MFTSPRFYAALVQECARFIGPKNVLIVGSPSDELMEHVLPLLESQDTLVVAEYPNREESLLPLRGKFGSERVNFSDKSVWQLDPNFKFQIIILAVSLNGLSADVAKTTLETCRLLLVNGGILTCFEDLLLTQPQPCFEGYRQDFSVYSETLASNLPPVRVHHLRFTPHAPQDCKNVRAVEGRDSLDFGFFRIAKDFLKFVFPLGAFSWGLKRLGSHLWYLPLVLLSGVAAFLRDPERKIEADPNLVLSACDGKVLDVAIVSDPNLGEGQWLRIATFLSIFNVHINRSPVAGKVIDQFDVVGGYACAQLPKANHNYSTYTVLATPQGKVVVAQRVGLIARRIYNWVGKGELLAQGERYGLIRMGSRTDVYLPCDKYESLVKVGDNIQAGITPIAKLNNKL
ncbi:phosphatidylserine decarboxylase [bacterium]|nr:phosphatidylserine decarboxylase [bacterium]